MPPLYATRETFSNVALYPNTLTDDPNAEPDATICSICTDDYSTMKCGALRMPECSHIFCATCIETWFDTASTCPMCRKDFFPISPEETSVQMDKTHSIFKQINSLLREAKRLYPQGRHSIDAIEEELASFGGKLLNDAKARKKRQRHRQEREAYWDRRRKLNELVRRRREERRQREEEERRRQRELSRLGSEKRGERIVIVLD